MLYEVAYAPKRTMYGCTGDILSGKKKQFQSTTIPFNANICGRCHAAI
jgi:hypothetical protein